jgi:hypothetical protein
LAQTIDELSNQETDLEKPSGIATTNIDTEALRNQRIDWVLNLIKK